MCRVKEGRVTKPSVVAPALPRRRRGRPAIDWTRSRKRRLLRLYLCTPEAELSLKKILALLAEGPFQPKPRHTQCLLNDMLSKSYRQKRPKSRAAMAERLAYLRSVRDGGLQTDSPRREVVEECAVLLEARPGGRRRRSRSSHPRRARDASGGEPDDDGADSPPCSPLDLNPRPDTAASSNPSRASLETGETRTSSLLESEAADADADAEAPPSPSPAIFRNPWSSCEDEDVSDRYEKAEFLRERCPSRSASFLADVASLLSGLSIRSSSLSRSSSSASLSSGLSRRRSVRSVSSGVEVAGSGVRGAYWEERRPSTDAGASVAESRGWSGGVAVPLEDISFSSSLWTSQMPKEPYNPGSSPHTLENQELVRFCCGHTSWCIHQRINAVLVHGSPPDTFACTTAEVDSRDGLGNTALHVAARWGAPGPVLLRIMTLASQSHLSAANNCGETFLHVLDPTPLGPGDLAHIAEYLASRGFNFTQLDDTGQSFASRLMARPSFALKSLEAVFCHLSEPDRRALFGAGPHQLIGAIRARLLAGPAQTAESVAAYCGYFSARYGTAAGLSG
ncbi:hypothetical protein C8A01DRAFT_46799 [Parachaetomium inaequale]|uniref:Uncharacterized protein n=1 Tax=Parachaetomium inaequale TaxID=2588326 RepID=A0AAN6SRT4_9PEZI|nr:hypothetical protein C8A01DRAFT_46799 [Parachaetomium inaequale]